ncbi:MAG: hypothetical protein Q8N47_00930 [Bryobacterales bacterium]|nr:hypothetical protein [Bryobacterales bacterium]
MGQYEADLKKDPAVRLVIGNLKSQLPQLFHSISQGQEFVAQSERGPAKGTYKQGRFKVSGSKQADGSLILQTEEAHMALEKMLQREGLCSSQVREALRGFDEAPEDTRATVAPGFDIVKWTVTGVDPALDARRLVVRFDGGEERLQGAGIAVLKIVYEYLALHLGAAIFGHVFSPIREALARNDPSLCPYRVQWKRGPKPAPFHGLVIEKRPPYLVIQVRLFGELIYRVHFPHLIPGGGFTRCKYTHDLTSGEEIFEEA